MVDRWTRLEKYAQWMQRRLKIECLPPDVMALVCKHLTHTAVCNLMEAINGYPALIKCSHDVLSIPVELRFSWLHRTACEVLKTYLHSMSKETCFHAREYTWAVYAFGDWSPFRCKPQMSDTLAEYTWDLNDSGHPRWNTKLNNQVVETHVRCMLEKKMCALRVTMHMVVRTGNHGLIFSPHEVSCTLVNVIPYFIYL